MGVTDGDCRDSEVSARLIRHTEELKDGVNVNEFAGGDYLWTALYTTRYVDVR